MMSSDVLRLQMSGISKRFGATRALHDVSLSAHAGEVLALVGENGAGKSTLMQILSGALQADAGMMLLDGRPYRPRGPLAARRAGVAMVYQELNIAGHLSVEDNVMLGREHSWYGWLSRKTQRTMVESALRSLGHSSLDVTTPAGQLSVGAQQVVEIARSLVERSKIIVLDEPTSSLPQHDVARLFETIERLRRMGMAVIYISHFLDEIRQVADRFAVLRDGEAIQSGRVADVTNAEMVMAMVGRRVGQLFPRVDRVPGEPLLSLDRLCGTVNPQDVTLQLRRGEILGIAGLVGAGRTELLRALYALDPVRSGTVRVGTLQPSASPAGRIAAGLGLVSEDRKGEGLAQAMSINDNLTLTRLAPYRRWGWLHLRKRANAAAKWADRLRVKRRSVDQPIAALSGGNQQKIALARVLHQEADILLLDEPTRGIDVGTKAEIYRLIGELAQDGTAIIFVSSYLPELLAICDRVGVMARGRLREVRDVDEWTEDAVMACAVEAG